MPISLTDIFLSVSMEKEMLMVEEWDGVLSCSRILSYAKRLKTAPGAVALWSFPAFHLADAVHFAD